MSLLLASTGSFVMKKESTMFAYLCWDYQRKEQDRNLYTSITIFFNFLSTFIIIWCHSWLDILSSVVFRWMIDNDLFFSIIDFLISSLVFINASILILFLWMKNFIVFLVFISSRGILVGWTDLPLFLNLIEFCRLRLSLKTRRVSGNS